MKRLQNKVNVNAPDANYQYGSMRDDTGSNDGTPADTDFMGDYTQFFERLFDQSGLTANGLPDNDTNGYQLYEALRTLFPLREVVVPIGPWNMDASVSVSVNIPGINFANIRGMSAVVLDDIGNFRYELAVDNGGLLAADSGTNNVILSRTAGGVFDSVFFSSIGSSRGFLTVRYTD